MKRLIKLTILLLTCFVSSSVFAASVNVSTTSSNVYVGDTASFKVTVLAGTWNLNVSGAASDKIVGFDMDGNVTTNKTYTVDTSKPGTYSISVTGDITDYDTDKNSAISKSATITVSARPNNPTPTTQPTTKPTTTRPTTTKRVTQTPAQVQQTPAAVEEPTTVVVEEPTEAVVTETVINVSKIKIVGYDFQFDPNKYVYDLRVGTDVDELYVMVDGEDIEVEGQGIVDISDKNSFTITAKRGDASVEYKFNLLRGSVLGVGEVSNNAVLGFKKALITLSLVTLLITCISLYYFVINKKSI